MADNKDTKETQHVDSKQRNFSSRGLSSNLPRANIVRIEALDGSARQRYLQGIQQFTDEKFRQPVYEKLANKEDNLFYGIMTDSDTSFNMQAQWNDSDAAGAVLGGIKAIGEKFTPNLYNTASGMVSMVDGVDKFIGKLTGTNSTATGSGTVKEFSGVSLNDMSIKCSWYLPEQYALCTKSLKILYRMAYPKQLEVEDLANSIGDIVKEGAHYVSDKASEFADNMANKLFSVDGSEDENKTVQKPASVGDNNSIIDKSIDGLAYAGYGYMTMKKWFGSTYTFNPLPVRLSVGHHIDVEPLVITAINTNFSEETFIAPNNRHLPIFVTTTIQFKYWLNPNPDIQFADILGESIYGVPAGASTSLKDSIKKVANPSPISSTKEVQQNVGRSPIASGRNMPKPTQVAGTTSRTVGRVGRA